ncbi:MAG: type VI secretion system tube protein Hcp [Acidobacteria bacterium]|nr:MAG: type VI secretion system tube protein Hcp [Acidobacteriota bacterium]
MALNAYLKLKGQKQGDIKGSVAERNREGSIMVIAVNHEVASPRDAATGQASGKRMHKPLVITKELDRSSPQLYNALTTNENIPEWTLEFSRPDPRGAEKTSFTIKLTNATISNIEFFMPNNKEPELMKLNEYEQVAFTYEKIEWTWLDPRVTAADSWLQRG